jgi:hypothetical protein
MMMGGDVGPAGKKIGSVLLAVMTLIGIVLFRFPTSQADAWDPHTMASNRIVSSIEAMVLEHARARGNVILTCWGISLNGEAVSYLAAKAGNQLNASALPDTATLSDYATAFDNADCVVAAEPLVWEFFGNLPGYKMLGQTLDLIRGNENFSLAGTVGSEGGPRYFVFYRLPAFTSWDSVQNLGTVEGPYPQWSLPLVRWGTGDQTILRFHSPSGGTYRLSVTAASPLDGQSITYLIDGKPVDGRKDDFPLGEVKSYVLSFYVPAGAHEIALKYAKVPDPSHDPTGHVMLYRRLGLALSITE